MSNSRDIEQAVERALATAKTTFLRRAIDARPELAKDAIERILDAAKPILSAPE